MNLGTKQKQLNKMVSDIMERRSKIRELINEGADYSRIEILEEEIGYISKCAHELHMEISYSK